jgi:hypothetical protein
MQNLQCHQSQVAYNGGICKQVDAGSSWYVTGCCYAETSTGSRDMRAGSMCASHVCTPISAPHLHCAALRKRRLCTSCPGQAIKRAHRVHIVAAVLLTSAEVLLSWVCCSVGNAGLANKVTTSLPAPVKETCGTQECGYSSRGDDHPATLLSKLEAHHTQHTVKQGLG